MFQVAFLVNGGKTIDFLIKLIEYRFVRQKGFVLLPVIIIFALLGVVGYLVYRNTQSLTGTNSQGAYLPKPSAAPTVEPTFPSPDVSCRKDGECKLVVSGSWSSCTLGDDCQPIDYSQSKWISVNSGWYTSLRNTNCPPDKYKPKGCLPKPVNDKYYARCVSQVCQKAPLSISK